MNTNNGNNGNNGNIVNNVNIENDMTMTYNKKVEEMIENLEPEENTTNQGNLNHTVAQLTSSVQLTSGSLEGLGNQHPQILNTDHIKPPHIPTSTPPQQHIITVTDAPAIAQVTSASIETTLSSPHNSKL